MALNLIDSLISKFETKKHEDKSTNEEHPNEEHPNEEYPNEEYPSEEYPSEDSYESDSCENENNETKNTKYNSKKSNYHISLIVKSDQLWREFTDLSYTKVEKLNIKLPETFPTPYDFRQVDPEKIDQLEKSIEDLKKYTKILKDRILIEEKSKYKENNNSTSEKNNIKNVDNSLRDNNSLMFQHSNNKINKDNDTDSEMQTHAFNQSL